MQQKDQASEEEPHADAMSKLVEELPGDIAHLPQDVSLRQHLLLYEACIHGIELPAAPGSARLWQALTTRASDICMRISLQRLADPQDGS